MSIKFKLTTCISALVAFILLLNLSITYFSTQSGLQQNAIERMETISRQIGTSIDSSLQARSYIESSLAEKLRAAAIAAEASLSPDIDQVSNDELASLSAKLDLDGLTLWRKQDDDIVVKKSSEPKEIGLGSKTMDYWYRAFQQLFSLKPVTVGQGQTLSSFWSGPINFATSDPSKIKKWGYYYDGSTNYMINPFLRAEVFLDFQKTFGTDQLVEQLLKDNPDILEITGIDPRFFGKAPIIKIKQGKPVYNLDVRDIMFGRYLYKTPENDKENVDKALASGTLVTERTTVAGKQLIKSFIPMHSDNRDYVISVSFNRSTIYSTLDHQLFVHGMISLVLLGATIWFSYLLSGILIRPLQLILGKVNAVAGNVFNTPLSVRSKDELGLLASQVNTMSDNLDSYTSRLREAAVELRSTKQYLESFVGQTSDAIHVYNLEGRLIQVNAAFENMFGWTMEEALGQPWPLVPDELREEYISLLRKVQDGGGIADYETQRFCKDGSPIDISTTVSGIRDEEGEVVAIAAISRNITARKHTEEVLRRSEKLSMVGQLAAGVAHEIRNPLTTLRGFVQLQQRTGRVSPSHLEMMLAELDRINFIVSEFLVLSKPQAVRYQPVDVKVIVEETVALLEAQASMNNVQVLLTAEDELPLLLGEANQLKQVFLNVLKNGMEAMPEGGSLRISISMEDSTHPPNLKKNQEGYPTLISINNKLTGEPNSAARTSAFEEKEKYLIVRIEDEGYGISEEDLARLGEPFYSSKATGHGLGLMVSQQILTNHKGTIRYRSELKKGTCVEISLPVGKA